MKHDDGKTRYDLIPLSALDEAAQVFTKGAVKYAPRNYLKGDGLSQSRLFAAALRHLVDWMRGIAIDPETGNTHLAHAICCLFMMHDLHTSGKFWIDD